MSDSEDDDKPVNSGSTIDDGIKFIEGGQTDMKSLRQKELGLTLILFGLAEQQGKRLGSLSTLVFDLEKEVFGAENIRNLDPSKVLELYKLGTAAVRESADYIKNTMKAIDWNSMENSLIATALEETSSNSEGADLKNMAQEILRKLKVNNIVAPDSDGK